MPNWTTNVVALEGDESVLAPVRAALDPENHHFDFNKLVPCPPELKITTSPARIHTDSDEPVKYGKTPSVLDNDEQGIISISQAEADRRMREHGATSWYEWQTSNWGTKWTGGRLEVLLDEPNRLVLRFDTAWCAPDGIYGYLREQDLAIIGGAIHEDGNEFQDLSDDDRDFADLFSLQEKTETETYEIDDEEITDQWTSRWIELHDELPAPVWNPVILAETSTTN